MFGSLLIDFLGHDAALTVTITVAEFLVEGPRFQLTLDAAVADGAASTTLQVCCNPAHNACVPGSTEKRRHLRRTSMHGDRYGVNYADALQVLAAHVRHEAFVVQEVRGIAHCPYIP
jgi:hypothetical protein